MFISDMIDITNYHDNIWVFSQLFGNVYVILSLDNSNIFLFIYKNREFYEFVARFEEKLSKYNNLLDFDPMNYIPI